MFVICYVFIHISSNVSTLSTANGTIHPALRNIAECHIPSYSYSALLPDALLEQPPCYIVRSAVYPLLLSSQYYVDADVDQALIPNSIPAPEGFQAAQNKGPTMLEHQ